MCKIHLGCGNKQLVNQKKKIKFLIFDIPNKSFKKEEICIQRTPLCDRYCYVTKCTEDKTESIYEPYNKYRRINYDLSKNEDFVQDMEDLIDKEINKLVNNEKIYFRIHSSGEFYSYKYFKKWAEIANNYIDNNKITFLAYTKSFKILCDYFNDFNKKPNININLSIIYDTFDEYSKNFKWSNIKAASNEDQINELSNKYNAKLYCAIPGWMKNKMNIDGYTQCKFAELNSKTSKNFNCGECMMCYESNYKKIYTELRNCSLVNYGEILEENDLNLAIKWYKDCIDNCINDEESLKHKYDAFRRLNILYKKNEMFNERKELLEKAQSTFKNISNIKGRDKEYFTRQLIKKNIKN